MRILFLSNFYPPYELGGYEQWCAEVAARLVARGHEIEVLTSNYGSRSGFSGDSPHVYRVLYLQSDLSYYRPTNFFVKRPLQDKQNIRILRQTIDRFQPELIMVWGMWNLSKFLPYWAEKWMPGRVAYFISNYWPRDVDPHTAYWNLPTRRAATKIIKDPLRKFALGILKAEHYPPRLQLENAVCCSHYVRDTLVKSGDLPERSGVIFGGIEADDFARYSKLDGKDQSRQPEPLKCVYFGRLIHDKGVHTAIEALGLLKQQGLSDNIQLTIIGSGHPAYEEYLQKLVDELGIREQVKFIKKVHRKDIPKLLSNFNIFLFTSIWAEPMARSVMEAMASGLLVIGTEVGGQAEMLSNGVNSLTFAPGDSSALAKQIALVSKHWLMSVQLARAGQVLVMEKFTLDRMVTDIEDYLANRFKAPAKLSE